MPKLRQPKPDYLNNLFQPYMYARGMTQKEAARIVGWRPETFSRKLKEGMRYWPVDIILRLGWELGISIDDLRDAIKYQ